MPVAGPIGGSYSSYMEVRISWSCIFMFWAACQMLLGFSRCKIKVKISWILLIIEGRRRHSISIACINTWEDNSSLYLITVISYASGREVVNLYTGFQNSFYPATIITVLRGRICAKVRHTCLPWHWTDPLPWQWTDPLPWQWTDPLPWQWSDPLPWQWSDLLPWQWSDLFIKFLAIFLVICFSTSVGSGSLMSTSLSAIPISMALQGAHSVD